jgi:hypothetical protein
MLLDDEAEFASSMGLLVGWYDYLDGENWGNACPLYCFFRLAVR